MRVPRKYRMIPGRAEATDTGQQRGGQQHCEEEEAAKRRPDMNSAHNEYERVWGRGRPSSRLSHGSAWLEAFESASRNE